MTLLEYIVEKEGEEYKGVSERYGYNSVEEYILCECCPSRFKCLKGTPYDTPYTKVRGDDYCKHNLEPNQEICTKCWNRKILI